MKPTITACLGIFACWALYTTPQAQTQKAPLVPRVTLHDGTGFDQMSRETVRHWFAVCRGDTGDTAQQILDGTTPILDSSPGTFTLGGWHHTTPAGYLREQAADLLRRADATEACEQAEAAMREQAFRP